MTPLCPKSIGRGLFTLGKLALIAQTYAELRLLLWAVTPGGGKPPNGTKRKAKRGNLRVEYTPLLEGYAPEHRCYHGHLQMTSSRS